MAVVNQERKREKKIKDVPESGARDYSKDPFFVKKRERAKEVIDKYGVPEEFLKNDK